MDYASCPWRVRVDLLGLLYTVPGRHARCLCARYPAMHGHHFPRQGGCEEPTEDNIKCAMTAFGMENDMKDNKQPEALRLADWLDDQYDPDHYKAEAATELRRLHAENAALQKNYDAGQAPTHANVAGQCEDVIELLGKYKDLCEEIKRGDSYHIGRIDAAISMLTQAVPQREAFEDWHIEQLRSQCPADSVIQHAAFEAIRKKLCALPRYSFVLNYDGLIRCVQDRAGNWIEFDDAHTLFDPVVVDAASKE